MVLARNAVHAALLLVANFFCLAVFYGAAGTRRSSAPSRSSCTPARSWCCFLFVLMLVGVDSSDSLVETLRGQRIAAVILGVGFAGMLAFPIGHIISGTRASGLDAANTGGNVQAIGRLLFTTYVFAFEIVSALLIVAASVRWCSATGNATGPRVNPEGPGRAAADAGGRQITPLPGPGVYARADAADTPAALPGGGVAPDSVPPEFEEVAVAGGADAETGGGRP